jgi:hypothetical protein
MQYNKEYRFYMHHNPGMIPATALSRMGTVFDSHQSLQFLAAWETYNINLIRQFHAYRTINSILRLNFGSIWFRYSGRTKVEAYSNADRFIPDRWHSITVDVRMATESKIIQMIFL